jgi:hypothetical protein
VKAVGYAAALLALGGAVFPPRAWEENRAESVRELRILFIGNSLTAANGLPEMVEAMSRAKGAATVVDATAVTTNNFSLEDHWNQGPARATIAKGGWSVIVLQQGPSALPESRVLLRDYAKRFAADAAHVGARTALYMVWPSKARQRDFDAVSKSYALAAQDGAGTLLPAGDAWREAWRRDPSLALYADDGFHPSALGTYLAALTIWRGLGGESAIGLPGPRGVPADTLKLLQEVADRTIVTASR